MPDQLPTIDLALQADPATTPAPASTTAQPPASEAPAAPSNAPVAPSVPGGEREPIEATSHPDDSAEDDDAKPTVINAAPNTTTAQLVHEQPTTKEPEPAPEATKRETVTVSCGVIGGAVLRVDDEIVRVPGPSPIAGGINNMQARDPVLSSQDAAFMREWMLRAARSTIVTTGQIAIIEPSA